MTWSSRSFEPSGSARTGIQAIAKRILIVILLLLTSMIIMRIRRAGDKSQDFSTENEKNSADFTKNAAIF